MENLALEKAVELGACLTKPQAQDGGKPFVVIPKDFTTQDIEEYLPKPTATRATVAAKTVASFIAYVQRFKKPASTIYADLDCTTLKAVIDHYDEESTSWNNHSVKYACPISKEWKRWCQRSEHRFNQTELAEFLEDNVEFIIDPNGSDLLSMVNNFKVIRQATFGSKVNVSSGEIKFEFQDETQKGSVKVPEVITLALAPFHNGTPYKVKARFFYRVKEGALTLWYKLIDPEKIIEDAFKDVCDQVQEALPEQAFYEAQLP